MSHLRTSGDPKDRSLAFWRMRKRWVVPMAVVALTLMTAAVALAALPIIDDFTATTTSHVVPVGTTYSFPGTTDSSILGGERDIYVYDVVNDAVTVGANSGGFQHSQNTTATAKTVLTYDGAGSGYPSTNAVGMSPQNLTSGGTQNAFIFRIARLDFPMDVRIKVYSDASNTSQFSATDFFVNTMSGYDAVVPFAAFTGSADFTAVRALEFEFIGSESDTDLTLDSIATTSLDWGDLPSQYKTLLGDDGPRHVITALKLGDTIDPSSAPQVGELNGQPTAAANGDDINGIDDEDGVTPDFTTAWNQSNGGAVNVKVSGITDGGCLIGWVDWNKDGDFEDFREKIIDNVRVTSNGTVRYPFDIPSNLVPGEGVYSYYARFRLYPLNPLYGGIPAGCAYPKFPTGIFLWAGGEVEDYRWDFGPTAVELTSLAATIQEAGIEIGWDTANEAGNLGFNLYRSTAPDEPGVRLNPSLIPVQEPGSPVGQHYSYLDNAGLVSGTTYSYWVEDVSASGAATRHEPISVLYTGSSTGPNAIRVARFGAAAAPAGLPAAGLLLGGVAAGTGAWLRRRRRAA